jgi:hypothetical protein
MSDHEGGTMLGTWMALVAPPALAATLEVDLKDRTGALVVPREMEVAVGLKGGPEGKAVEASWDNTAGSTLAVVCGAKGEPAADDIAEQLMLMVGDDKWGLAPGSGVRFTCPAGKPVTVTDRHGEQVGTFPSPLVLTVTKAKARAER